MIINKYIFILILLIIIYYFIYKNDNDNDNNNNINIIVINLDKRPIRLRKIIELFKNIKKPKEYDIKFNRMKANEGFGDYKLYSNWVTNQKLHGCTYYWKDNIKKGEIGCTLSHLSCIKKYMHNKKNDINIIFEDDVYFENDLFLIIPNILSELNVIDNNWELLYLGGNNMNNKKKIISDTIIVPSMWYQAHAYILSKKGINKILNIEKKITNNLIPWDECLNALSWTHPRIELNKLYLKKENKLNTYATNGYYVRQLQCIKDGGDGWSDTRHEKIIY